MTAELTTEAESLLVDLTFSENALRIARENLDKRALEISESVGKDRTEVSVAERERLGRVLRDLIRTKYRSELASLGAEIVREERRRAKILRKLDAYPQFGESGPAIDIAIEHDGERGFTIKTGGGRIFQFKLPAIIDRGVWRGDGEYERGDAVTSDGSLWIAREDNPTHEPGKGPQWRLAVTKGKNGRDASRITRSST